MKKNYLLLLLLCAAVTAHAQTTWGIKAGPVFAQAATRANGVGYPNKMVAGVTAGAYAYIPLRPALILQPSLLYEGKGGKAGSNRNRLDYLSCPVALVFTPRIGYGNLLLGAGPYIAYALSGRVMNEENGTGKNLFKGEQAVRRWDAGVHVQLSYEFNNGVNIGVGQETGCVNLYKGAQAGNSMRNRSYYFTIGYRLK